MFNLFKKKVEDPLAGIFSSASENQKMSISTFLLFTLSCDLPKGNQNQEFELLNQYADILDIDADKAKGFFDATGWPRLLSELKLLNHSQKEFLIFMSLEMINCDGQMNEAEERFISNYFEKLGFTEAVVMNAINRGQAIMKDLTRR